MAISNTTVKRLFAESGNVCAFAGCSVSMVDTATGTVVGEICHIKAKSSGGPRYDATLSESDRDAYENLLLLCPSHHTLVDSAAAAYTVHTLVEMKQRHVDRGVRGPEISDGTAERLAAAATVVVGGSVITTVNQRGGQVAHQIVNLGPPRRSITTAIREEMLQILRAHTGSPLPLHSLLLGPEDPVVRPQSVNRLSRRRRQSARQMYTPPIVLLLILGGCRLIRGYDWKVAITSEPSGLETYIPTTGGVVRPAGNTPLEIPVQGGDLPLFVRMGDRILGFKIKPETSAFHVTVGTPSVLDYSDKILIERFTDMVRGKIQRGFSKVEVIGAWGYPNSTSSHSSGTGSLDIWTYNSQTSYGIATAWQTVTFENGKVSAWSSTDLGR